MTLSPALPQEHLFEALQESAQPGQYARQYLEQGQERLNQAFEDTDITELVRARAELVDQVYSIEIVPELARSAAALLQELDYDNVTVRAGDGYQGWPEHAPFDGIIVTAAAPEIPPPLLEQLKPGAPLVIPVGEHLGYQELLLVTRDASGAISQRSVLPVRFVPLTGER